MPDVGRVFKEESTRLARKEVKTAVNPLNTQIRELRKGMSGLKSRLAEIEKLVTKLQPTTQSQPIRTDEAGTSIRVSPGLIKKLRKRLKLSQEKMGKLIGVGAITVLNWEQGKTRPKPTSKEAIAELRTMSITDVNAILEGLS